MVIYDKSATEKVPSFSGETFSEERVTRTYHDNYAAIGGAIAFGVIAASSLLAIALVVRNEKSHL